MTTINAEAFVKDIYTNSSEGTKNETPQYVFDSKKEVELKRLNEQHYALVELQRDRLIHSPLDRPKRILDVFSPKQSRRRNSLCDTSVGHPYGFTC